MPNNKNLKVLYVDDEPDVRMVVSLSLGIDPDLDVRIAESGAAALDLLAREQWRPDILLLDVMMPEMSGSALLHRLREQPALAKIPALFVTAGGRQSDLENYRALGADGLITKPFDPLTLARTVRDFCENLSG